MFLDFDGSLADIVPLPDRARPASGAAEAVGALVGRYRVVAVVSGRRSEDVEARLGLPGVRYIGLYGMAGGREASEGLRDEVAVVVAAVPAAWVEPKGASLSVHYRQASDPVAARRVLLEALSPVAAREGLELLEGKMVLELIPAGRPLKGGVIDRTVRDERLTAALFAGDDVADLDAFDALDRLAVEGVITVRVAVRGPETPEGLVERADVTADGPAGLVDVLRQLL